MEEEEEEARALLPGGPDGAGGDSRAAPAASGALQALCDPSRLAHRFVVLLLMCFLGFGEPAGRPGGGDWKSSNSRRPRSCVELQGPPALFLPHLRDPRSTLLQAIQFPKVRGQGTELSDFCHTHLLSQEVPKASNLPSGALDMRESLDVKVPSHDTLFRGN